ncbi:TIGR01212 family radical SAM protein [Miniphocaeibacter halophilus]|uniref:TIGR01212 family radical SAM protein n=1 Tax=Miniphocaeibacter halophilus TaxID=2931922 RepID=A0AC61MPU2_9FIRM|nr:TIGR01212 family radical SAM protein [Miniphocaeibacter halophilus]QQK07487.1 TIGR01212 family radical SAM protein [Miniphocaeibacter halophilus]
MSKETLYLSYSEYLRNNYGEKVYKLPVKLNLTCPNRDNNISVGGCIFCNEKGGSFENLDISLTVKEQILKNKEYIGNKYNAKKFIVYFQNFSNTYMDFEKFKKIINECNMEDIVAIDISTRPDCIYDIQLEYLENFSNETNIDIIFELGLQTANYHTLKILNRGHGISEFVLACKKIKERNFKICTHVIIGLPWDNELDIIETAKLISVLDNDEVKIHSLYIPKNTKLEKMYENKEIELITLDKYVEYVVLFLRYLKKDIAIQRLVGRMPKEDSVFCNWGTSWWKIRDKIENTLEENNFRQGDLCNHLDGISII